MRRELPTKRGIQCVGKPCVLYSAEIRTIIIGENIYDSHMSMVHWMLIHPMVEVLNEMPKTRDCKEFYDLKINCSIRRSVLPENEWTVTSGSSDEWLGLWMFYKTLTATFIIKDKLKKLGRDKNKNRGVNQHGVWFYRFLKAHKWIP